MKIFIINLEHQTEKRQFIQEQLDRLGLEAEFIAAINGKSMSDDQLKEVVHDYENCSLTAGEIGCALSHISAYKKIIDQNISQALILEDDAILKEGLPELLSQIKQQIPAHPTTYLLTSIGVYDKKPVHRLSSVHTIHRVLRSICAHGYVINLAAAKNLAAKLLPVRFEADRWDFFYKAGVIDLYCITPMSIDNRDRNKENSNLEEDRKPLVQARIAAYEKLIKDELPFYLKVKWQLWRIFKRPFIEKVKR